MPRMARPRTLAEIGIKCRCRVTRVLMPAQLIFYRDNTWSAGRYIPGVLCVLS